MADKNTIQAVIKVRRETEAYYDKIKSTFIPEDGELCLVDTVKTGLRMKVGNGVTTWEYLNYFNQSVMQGYYFNGVFWEDEEHTELMNSNLTSLYIDLTTGNKIYYFNGTTYTLLSSGEGGSTSLATSTDPGIMKLYDNLVGNNTDGTVTQKVVADAVKGRLGAIVDEPEETVEFGPADGSEGAGIVVHYLGEFEALTQIESPNEGDMATINNGNSVVTYIYQSTRDAGGQVIFEWRTLEDSDTVHFRGLVDNISVITEAQPGDLYIADGGPIRKAYICTSVLANGTPAWYEFGNKTGDVVLSFNGRTGAVTPAEGDYTAEMVGAVPTTRTVNGMPLSSNIAVDYKTTGALPFNGTTVNGQKFVKDSDDAFHLNLTPADIGAASADDVSDAAEKLETPVNLNVDLASETAASFDGSTDATLGVTGVLPIIHGGSGASTLAGAQKALGIEALATDVQANRTELAAMKEDVAVNTQYTRSNVPQTRKINGKALTSDITLTASDVGALPVAGKAKEAETADALSNPRTLTVALDVTEGAEFDGTSDVAIGVDGTLPVTSGGTGASTIPAAQKVLGIDVLQTNQANLLTRVANNEKTLVPNTRKINGKPLNADITLTTSDIGSVPVTRTINGKNLGANISLNASDVKEWAGVCLTNSDVAAKTVSIQGLTKDDLKDFVKVTISFTKGNTATNPTLNINSLGAYPIYAYTNNISPGEINPGSLITLVFGGTGWFFENNGILASSDSYGVVKTSDAIDSNAGNIVATSKAVKAVADIAKAALPQTTTINGITPTIANGKYSYNIPTGTVAFTGTSSDNYTTTTKTIVCSNWSLTSGNQIKIKFSSGSYVRNNPVYFNVNGTGSKEARVVPISRDYNPGSTTQSMRGIPLRKDYWYTFTYNGTYYVLDAQESAIILQQMDGGIIPSYTGQGCYSVAPTSNPYTEYYVIRANYPVYRSSLPPNSYWGEDDLVVTFNYPSAVQVRITQLNGTVIIEEWQVADDGSLLDYKRPTKYTTTYSNVIMELLMPPQRCTSYYVNGFNVAT